MRVELARDIPALSIIYANARPWFKIVPLVDGKVAKELKTLKMPSDQRVPKSEHDVGKLSGRRPYPDLHDHLQRLDRAGLLITVNRPINKDTEMHPLVRWQFRGGIEEKDRKAFLFTNVTDSKGRKYDIPVVIGALAANREIYRLGMGCALDEINQVWQRALAKPIPPRVVTNAPRHDIVI